MTFWKWNNGAVLQSLIMTNDARHRPPFMDSLSQVPYYKKKSSQWPWLMFFFIFNLRPMTFICRDKTYDENKCSDRSIEVLLSFLLLGNYETDRPTNQRTNMSEVTLPIRQDSQPLIIDDQIPARTHSYDNCMLWEMRVIIIIENNWK